MKSKRILCFGLCLVLIAVLAGCFQNKSDMPFNGQVTFHSLQLTIPEEYIRDSTQSTDEAWLFEQGWYKKTIVLLCRQIQEEPESYLTAYATGMESLGIQADSVTFLGMQAVKCSATKEDGVFWQEVSFVYNGAFYAVAMNGGTQAEFQALLDTAALNQTEK